MGLSSTISFRLFIRQGWTLMCRLYSALWLWGAISSFICSSIIGIRLNRTGDVNEKHTGDFGGVLRTFTLTFYTLQRRFLYFPQLTSTAHGQMNASFAVDGAQLVGWVLNEGQSRALIYYGGNLYLHCRRGACDPAGKNRSTRC